MSISTKIQGCDTCNKSVLSLLLLRPSPISKQDQLAPVGAKAVKSADELVDGLVPSRKLTESRYVLRMLRQGYVYVYIPSPPPGSRKWLTFRVQENGDLIAQENPLFAQLNQKDACPTPGHNAAGMKLLPIPQAHKVGSIWLAFSANLWNDKLKAQNAANPKVMQQVNLLSCGRHTFTPTVDSLKSQVLECALPQFRAGNVKDQDFPFNSQHGEVDSLVANLQRAAACHPRTKGMELAVVLADPVGIAAELNALRLRRQELAEQYLLKEENRQPIEVNKVLDLLEGNVIADADDRAMESIAPLRLKSAYEKMQSTPGAMPSGTTWRPIDPIDRKKLQDKADNPWLWALPMVAAPLKSNLASPDLGRIIYPDFDARAQIWASKEATRIWSKMHKYYDEDKRKAWKNDLAKRMNSLFLLPLKREEADWVGALGDPSLTNYFCYHFDELEANAWKDWRKNGMCSGSVYVSEVVLGFTPEPVSDAAISFFEAHLDRQLSDTNAILLRAVLANQMSLAPILESSAIQSDDGKRDKTFDFMKGLIGEAKGLATHDGSKPLGKGSTVRFAWLTDATLGFSFGLVGTLSAVAIRSVATAIDASKTSKAPIPADVLSRLSKAQSMALIHRAAQEALDAVNEGRALNAPVFMQVDLDLDTAIKIKQMRGEMINRKTIQQWSKRGRVQIGIVTDAYTLKELSEKGLTGHDLRNQAIVNASVVRLQEQAINLKGEAIKAAATGGMLVLPIDKFYPLYEQHQARAAKAPSLVTSWLKSLGRSSTNLVNSVPSQAVRAGVLSLEGRLAVGTMIVQGIGFIKGLSSLEGASTADASLDAGLSIADGAVGIMGGMTELAGAMWEARLALIRGSTAVDASVMLPALRGLANGLGVAGGVLNAWMSFRSADKLKAQGNLDLARWMIRGGNLFVAGGIPLGFVAIHSLAEAAAKRGMFSVGSRAIIAKVGETLGKRVLLVSVPGWGWALTAVAVGHTIYVIQHTPTAIQNWLKNCYFGKPDNPSLLRKTWAEEESALRQMQEDAMTPEEKQRHNQRLVETSERA